MLRKWILLSLVFFGLVSQKGHADCCRGKVDVGPTWIRIDVLQSGKTVDTIDMGAIKVDSTIVMAQGFCFKPGLMVGHGDGDIATASLGLGYYIPVGYFFPSCEGLTIIPGGGLAYSYFKMHVDYGFPDNSKLKQIFRSYSPFIGIEVCYRITEKLTLLGMAQYAWAKTRTTIERIGSENSHSEGPNYSLGVDYSFNENWSVTAGGGYNISLSKEKHGLRAMGAKLGIAYYF